jgi:hypothetical protein
MWYLSLGLMILTTHRVPEYTPRVSRALGLELDDRALICFYAQAAYQIMEYLIGRRNTP